MPAELSIEKILATAETSVCPNILKSKFATTFNTKDACRAIFWEASGRRRNERLPQPFWQSVRYNIYYQNGP